MGDKLKAIEEALLAIKNQMATMETSLNDKISSLETTQKQQAVTNDKLQILINQWSSTQQTTPTQSSTSVAQIVGPTAKSLLGRYPATPLTPLYSPNTASSSVGNRGVSFPPPPSFMNAGQQYSPALVATPVNEDTNSEEIPKGSGVSDSSKIDKWLEFASKKKAEDLYLEVLYGPGA